MEFLKTIGKGLKSEYGRIKEHREKVNSPEYLRKQLESERLKLKLLTIKKQRHDLYKQNNPLIFGENKK